MNRHRYDKNLKNDSINLDYENLLLRKKQTTRIVSSVYQRKRSNSVVRLFVDFWKINQTIHVRKSDWKQQTCLEKYCHRVINAEKGKRTEMFNAVSFSFYPSLRNVSSSPSLGEKLLLLLLLLFFLCSYAERMLKE